ncbi:MAG: hypothetical protein H6602_02895 [Flavobacteriales bacterium]|nr:hypothetical protein [Flavobacteriales bacterium]MCB9190594.1 hypothetical protein [Flavobacteriales bacterium]
MQNPIQKKDILTIRIPEKSQKKLDEYKKSIDAVKKYVKAEIEFQGKVYDCELRLHGSDNRNWTGFQTSYRIKLDKEGDFINHGRNFQLIKLDEANSPILAANKLARNYNLISSYGQLVAVNENGADKGIYYMTEAIDKTFLEREFGITNYTEIVNTNDWTRKEGSRHNTDLDLYYGHIEADKGSPFRRALYQFKLMVESEDPTEDFFDKEYLARFFSIFPLFNDMGFIVGDNMKLIYNFDNGKFYPIFRIEYWGQEPGESLTFWDSFGRKEVSRMNNLVFSSHADEYENCETAKLFKKLLSNNEVRYMRDTMLFNMYGNREEVLGILSTAYEESRPLLYHATIDQYRKISSEEQKQHHVVSYLLEYFQHYLRYGHVYGSYDKSQDRLELHLDSYVPMSVIDTVRKNILVKHWTGILFDQNLNHQYNRFVLNEVLDTLDVDDLIFVNEVTNDTIPSKHVHINRISSKGRFRKKDASDMEFLSKHSIKYEIHGDSLVILPGKYKIDRNNVLVAFNIICVKPGVEFKFEKNSNLYAECEALYMNGTKEKPVLFTGSDEPFGNVSFKGRGTNATFQIANIIVEKGSFSRWLGRATSGQFSIFNAVVHLSNSIFRNSHGDDGLNLKFCKAEIRDCQFYLNNADQVDLDFCIAKVFDCSFRPSGIDANGDGLDFSGSYAFVSGCNFEGFEDKSMSVGERSLVFVEDNTFKSNNWSICAKDQSNVYANNNAFEDNAVNYIGYVKKNMFASPTIFGDDESVKLSDTLQCNYSTWTADQLNAKLEKFHSSYESFDVAPGLNHKQYMDHLILKELIP